MDRLAKLARRVPRIYLIGYFEFKRGNCSIAIWPISSLALVLPFSAGWIIVLIAACALIVRCKSAASSFLPLHIMAVGLVVCLSCLFHVRIPHSASPAVQASIQVAILNSSARPRLPEPETRKVTESVPPEESTDTLAKCNSPAPSQGNDCWGTLTGQNGLTWEGRFETGELTWGNSYNGEGELKYPDGTKHVSAFYDGELNSKGTYSFGDGFKKLGVFANGMPKGEMIVSDAKSRVWSKDLR